MIQNQAPVIRRFYILQFLGFILQGLDQFLFGLQVLLDLTELQHCCPVVPSVVGGLCLRCCHLEHRIPVTML